MTILRSVVAGSLAILCSMAPASRSNAADDLTQWRYSREILFNTTADGGNVTADVRDYPVAVALSGENFPGDQTLAKGADLRFADPAKGSALKYSIEHWDSDGRTALVWVKVPVVPGGAKGPGIRMHWGNAKAADASDSHAVFDVAAGFVGVWHLGDEPGVAPEGYHDSTINAAHGTGVNMTAQTRAAGVLGQGLNVKHAESQWVKVDSDKRKLFDLTDRVTFSAWALCGTFSNRGDESRRALPGYETIFAKGDNSWRLQKFGVRDWHKPPADLLEICVEKAPRGDMCVVGKTDMKVDAWYHLVGVHDHPRAHLYVNGVLDATQTFDAPWSSGDHPVGIGNQSQFPQQGRNWDGLIDEARVMSVAKDEHWIKLDYESQRSGQKFLSFGAAESRRQ